MKTFFKTQVFNDSYETSNRLAMDFIRFTEYMFQYRDKLYIAISGGSTPNTWFNIMATEYAKAVDWKRLHFFWVDERCVDFSNVESNFGTADRLLFQKINIPRENLHPILGAEKPENEAVRYTGEILAHIPCSNKFPVFDVIILGMGNDGHTASIFPGQLNLFDSSVICSVSKHPESGQKRITLTGKVLNNALEIIFLVTGSSKAHQIKAIFEDLPGSETLPAKRIQPINGNLSWYLDKEAIENLKEKY